MSSTVTLAAAALAINRRKRREHPLFTDNPAISSARQRLADSSSAPPTPLARPESTPRPVPDTRPDALTENGAATFSSTGSACLDLFYDGTVRGTDSDRLLRLLPDAWAESPELTLQVLMNARDCRGGKGERLVITEALQWLRRVKPCTYIANALGFLRVGYFKDLLVIARKAHEEGQPAMGASGELIELELMAEFIRFDLDQLAPIQAGTKQNSTEHSDLSVEAVERDVDGEEKKGSAGAPQISLAAKWAPTEGSHWDRGSLRMAHRLARLLFPKDGRAMLRYRRALSALRAHLVLVERLMCANEWEAIDFARVPAKAHLILKAAFARHQEERYAEYLGEVKAGKKVIKTAGLQPHELVKPYRSGRHLDETVEAQWRALVDRVRTAGGLPSTLPLVDVSGSMTCNQGSVEPLDPAIAIGLLAAELCTGDFHGHVVTFEADPRWHIVQEDSLHAQVRALKRAPWGGNTDLQRVFDLILGLAVHGQVDPASMPSTLLILSDMEFDDACHGASVTNFEVARTKYQLAGYSMPRVVFWNLSVRGKNAPVRMDQRGVSLLSGFSGELLKLLVDGKTVTPMDMMRLAVEQYEVEVDDHEK